jgi:hypothetical protein
MTTPPKDPRDSQPSSGREQMRDAVNQVMKQVNDQKQENRAEVVAAREHKASQSRMRWLQAIVLATVLVISLVFAIPRWRQPFAAPSGAEAEHDARHAVVFAAQLVEQHIHATGRAPQSLEQLGIPLPGIRYQRLDSLGYVVSATVEDRTLSFRRGDDQARFAGTR